MKRSLGKILYPVLAIMIVAGLLIGGCSEPAPAPAPTPAPTPAPETEPEYSWPQTTLTISSQPPESVGYPLDVAWSTAVAEGTGMKVRLVSESEAVLSYTWVKEGRLDLGFFEFGQGQSLEGTTLWATRDLGPWQMRLWWPHGKGGRGYAVRGDSGLKVPSDLKPGMRVIYHDFIGPMGRMFGEAIVAWSGLNPDDLEWIPANSIAATSTLLMEGKGDVVVGWPASPQWLEVEASPHGLGWLSLDAKAEPEAAARFNKVDASAGFGIMRVGVPSAGDLPMIVTIPSMITSADQNIDLIYNLVKWMDENHDAYKDLHPYCEAMTLDTMLELAEIEFVPVHDGVILYLTEKGLWTADHQARQDKNVALLTSYVDAYAEAIVKADAAGVKVAPANDEWLKLWEDYKVEKGLAKFALWKTFP
jgi:TRAP-type uncharacterized transport system substrate-binding protein